ncbi:glycosyltransferase family 2 protein [Pontibacter sp. BT310]|uniref:Glycosyltransferase family 2 protein n=1 Tax=Pontibacter populi TaxID=890055 RepID=A0ABS6XF83_9BACT|nr:MULTISPECIES: glycosyltransferase [Pontibacter]MBJ6119792.1 glycosyltransferase family 2 protein [Pontibacter sp. BT310]MBR0572221.1 glycosyltransferase family 2 protein [Microvirga sp. STS03]MBW3366645.1 glycosyltransferase family 2 protein [Pontibacter populi]
MSIGVSVIVCCYNSESRIPTTLEYLANQQLDADTNLEIIIVNNNSTDKTAEIAVKTWASFSSSFLFQIVNQPIPGLSAAREKGIEAATFDILIFCDDDNWLSPDYVIKAYEILKSNTKIAAVGGINLGVFETPPPKWITIFEASYALGNQGSMDFEVLQGNKYIVGAGMALNKLAYIDIKQRGFNFFLTDRIGNKIVGGGDVELCYILKIAGYQIAFSSELTLEHYMPTSRMTESYLTKMWHNYSYSWLVFEAYKIFLFKKDFKSYTYFFWKVESFKRLFSKSKGLLFYLRCKRKGNLSYCLPYEAELLFNTYLFFNTKRLLKITQNIHQKLYNE